MNTFDCRKFDELFKKSKADREQYLLTHHKTIDLPIGSAFIETNEFYKIAMAFLDSQIEKAEAQAAACLNELNKRDPDIDKSLQKQLLTVLRSHMNKEHSLTIVKEGVNFTGQ